MPIYEYECLHCSRIFEERQSIKDTPVTECSECGGEVKKLVSMSAFHLKGGGWYSDGYASGKGKTDTAGEKKPAPEKKESTTGTPAPACAGGSCKGCPAAA